MFLDFHDLVTVGSEVALATGRELTPIAVGDI